MNITLTLKAKGKFRSLSVTASPPLLIQKGTIMLNYLINIHILGEKCWQIIGIKINEQYSILHQNSRTHTKLASKMMMNDVLQPLLCRW